MKTLNWIITTVLISTTFVLNAQDGEKLFKSKCATCHALDRESTGPMLQGAKAKWEAAGELEYLYEWVQNSTELINSGKSSMAISIKDFNPTAMSPQQVTPEEVDAILAYVDGWEPPVETSTANNTNGTTAEAVIVPNYDQNLDLFYALIVVTIVLLIAIIIMAGTVTRFVKSDFFKDKLKNKENVVKTLVLFVLFTGLAATNTFALEFNGPGEATEDMPWLLIESRDLYALLAIDLVLVGVLFYLRRMFNTFLAMTKKKEELAAAAEESEVLKKVNQILTDVVPIEEEHKILMDHEYDGIKELDNNLPPWWVWGFYFTIGFAVVYLLNYHVFGTSDLQIEAYKKDMKRAEAEVQAYLEKQAMNVTEDNVTILDDPEAISAGKAIFKDNCVLCHSENGEGIAGSGPNLTDKSWIYGYDVKDVFTTVKYGRPGGMPEHENKLNPIQLQQVSSYVLQLPEKKGVEPKGDIIEEDAPKPE